MINNVVKRKLCTNCGTCISACPVSAIFISRKENNFEIQVDEKKCTGCGLCLRVCPGLAVDFQNLSRDLFGKDEQVKYDPYLGHYRNCYLAYSRDENLRFQCSSGGAITALLLDLLEKKVIDGALVTTMDPRDPLVSKPFIAYTKKELIEAKGSKYTPVVLNQCLKEILKSKRENFAVVGLPCHIQGIRKFQEIDPILKKKIKICLGLVCGQEVNFIGTRFILRKLGIEAEEVKEIYYRGDGWPGYMKVVLKNGQIKKIPYLSAFKVFNMGFFTPERCFLCPDLTNELADISFGDAWLPKLIARKEGFNMVITRTKPGQEIFERGSVSHKKIAPELFKESKKIRLFCKKDSYRIIKLLASLFHLGVPKYRSEPEVKIKFSSAAVVVFYLNAILSGAYPKFFLRMPLFFWNVGLRIFRDALSVYKSYILNIK